MKDIIRDSTVGQVINSLSGGRYLPYAEQRSDYTVPAHFLLPPRLRRRKQTLLRLTRRKFQLEQNLLPLRMRRRRAEQADL
jgi:hypothetical protein